MLALLLGIVSISLFVGMAVATLSIAFACVFCIKEGAKII
jgi:hypothetical protein